MKSLEYLTIDKELSPSLSCFSQWITINRGGERSNSIDMTSQWRSCSVFLLLRGGIPHCNEWWGRGRQPTKRSQCALIRRARQTEKSVHCDSISSREFSSHISVCPIPPLFLVWVVVDGLNGRVLCSQPTSNCYWYAYERKNLTNSRSPRINSLLYTI